jgi:putative ABC transport system permease protein
MDIGFGNLAIGYSLLIIPFAIILWYRVPIFNQAVVSIVRMTVQLLFVGLYLQVVFELNNPWLTAAWVLVMILVADFSITRSTDLRLRKFAGPLFIALLTGTIVPLLFFVELILRSPGWLNAPCVIPIGGMILGNCLRADIIGVRTFYESIQKQEKVYLQMLGQGAKLSEAVRPFLRDAVQAAIMPTVATMATIGLVSLPGMMTGVILGGSTPMTAIKYQIAIMIAIFTGTTMTVILAIWMTVKSCFSRYGLLDRTVFK